MDKIKDFRILADETVRETYEKNRQKAQYALDSQIWNDMLPMIPIQTGVFKNMLWQENASLAGTGNVVIYDGVYGRFLYEGKVMVDSRTGKGARKIELEGGEIIFRYRKGAKLIASGRNITYSQPGARAHWYDVAESANLPKWEALVRKVLTYGRR